MQTAPRCYDMRCLQSLVRCSGSCFWRQIAGSASYIQSGAAVDMLILFGAAKLYITVVLRYLPYFYTRIFEYTDAPIVFNFFGDKSAHALFLQVSRAFGLVVHAGAKKPNSFLLTLQCRLAGYNHFALSSFVDRKAVAVWFPVTVAAVINRHHTAM